MRDEAPTPKERVQHIINAIEAIQEFTQGMDEEAFVKKNFQTQSAVLYQYIIIGEAIRYIEPEILYKYDYPWHLVRAFRNFIAHVYHGIKLEKVWNTTETLNELKIVIEEILKNEF